MAKQVNQEVTDLQGAVQVLVQGVQIGQSKGVYSFEDAAIIKSALDFLKQKPEGAEGAEEAPQMEAVEETE